MQRSAVDEARYSSALVLDKAFEMEIMGYNV